MARERLGFARRHFPHKTVASELKDETPIKATEENKSKQHFWARLTRRQKILLSAGSIAGLAVVLTAFFIFFPKTPEPTPATPAKVAAEPPKPVLVASPLSGQLVSPELAKRPVTAIMIENSMDARPQSGLHEAGVVFEAIAEGGITRFIALYQDTTPQFIGPVRSLRPYYLDFAVPFQAGIAHVGGSPEALAQVRAGLRDLDQFFNAGAFWRNPGRAAPHNVYTSFEKLDALNQAKGYAGSEFKPWPRKEDSKLAAPTATKIDVNISSALYNSHYDYDPASNSYARSEGGRPHISTSSQHDPTGQQIKPKSVIVMVMGYSVARTRHSVYQATGSGQLFVFQDGGLVQGTWHKPSREAQFEFKDAAGQPISLNNGQSWVTVVANPSMVVHAP